MELIDGYNNEAVKGGGCPCSFIIFLMDGWSVCVCVCCVCAMVFFSLSKRKIFNIPSTMSSEMF